MMRLKEIRLKLSRKANMPNYIFTKLEIYSDLPDIIIVDKGFESDDFESTFECLMKYLTNQVSSFVESKGGTIW